MPYQKRDRALSETMMDAWATFAANGDPNGADTPVWAPYDAGRDNYLEFGDMVRTGKGWRTKYLDFLERYFDTL
jgi:carboxylesterase type B